MPDFSRLLPVSPEMMLSSSPLAPPPVPVRLSLAHHGERAGPSVLSECFARIGYRYEMERLPDMPFTADLALNILSDVLVAEGAIHGSRNRRTRKLVEDGTDDAVLIINLAGEHLIEQFDEELVLGNGDAVLVSGSDPSCFTHKPPGRMLGLRLPKHTLLPLMKNSDDAWMRLIPRGSSSLRHLIDYMATTWSTDGDGALRQLMANHIRQLVALTLGATSDTEACAVGEGQRLARLAGLKKLLRENLTAELSLEQVAALWNTSPRALQRLFAGENTSFTAWVLQERLELARFRLISPAHAHEKIATIALDCGFGDLSHFNRSFRRAFGRTPSDVRAESQAR